MARESRSCFDLRAGVFVKTAVTIGGLELGEGEVVDSRVRRIGGSEDEGT